MKRTFPAPMKSSLEATEEEEPSSPIPNFPVAIVHKQGATTAVERMLALARQGKTLRAVVVHMEDFENDKRAADPKYWGIIVDTSPLSHYPLKVQWVDGRSKWTDGFDIRIVYSGCAEAQMLAWIAGQNKEKQ